MNEWSDIDERRDAASKMLAALGRHRGAASILHLRCQALWQASNEQARWSLLRGDFCHAEAVLQVGLRTVEQTITSSSPAERADGGRLGLGRRLWKVLAGDAQAARPGSR